MTSDLDIYRSANELIKQYGDAADNEAAMRADERLAAGDSRSGIYGKKLFAANQQREKTHDTPSCTAIYRGNSSYQSTGRRRCLEQPKPCKNHTRLHKRQHLAEPR